MKENTVVSIILLAVLVSALPPQLKYIPQPAA